MYLCPAVNSAKHSQAVLRTVRVTFAALGGSLLLALVAGLVVLHRMRLRMKRTATIYPQLGTLQECGECEDQSVVGVSLETGSGFSSRSDLSQCSADKSESRTDL